MSKQSIYKKEVVLTARTAAMCFLLTLTACNNTQHIDESIDAKLAGQTTFTPQDWANSSDTLKQGPLKRVDWLQSFNDPLLVDLVAQSLANNRNLMAAAANVEKARALAVQAGAQLQPQASLSLANARTGVANNSQSNASSQTLAVQLNWEADLWGRISAGQRAAFASAEAAEADYKYAQHSLAAATAKAYFIAIEAEQQTEILTRTLGSLAKTLRIVTVQHDNGLATGQDVALTRSDLASSREQLLTLQASQREALRALEVLLGRYPKGELSVNTELPQLPTIPTLGIPSELLERRPDLIAAERQVAAAFNLLVQAKAARLPTLSLSSNIGGSSTALSDITNPANIAWQLASNILLPVFDGGARQSQVEIATADQKQALAAYAQSALTAFQEVETNLDLGATLAGREMELGLALDEASKAYKIAQIRHQEGEIGLIDLLTVQQRVLSAESNKLSVRRYQLEQRVNLSLALGGAW